MVQIQQDYSKSDDYSLYRNQSYLHVQSADIRGRLLINNAKLSLSSPPLLCLPWSERTLGGRVILVHLSYFSLPTEVYPAVKGVFVSLEPVKGVLYLAGSV